MDEEINLSHLMANTGLITETQPISLRQLRRTRKKETHIIIKFPQVMLTVIAFLVGLFVGFLLRTRYDVFSNDFLLYWKFFGTLCANVLNILVLPLLITKTFISVVQMSKLIVFKLISSTLAFILLLHFFATLEAIGWSFIGKSQVENSDVIQLPLQSVYFIDSILDFSRNIFPEDFLNATIYMSETVYIPPQNISVEKFPIENWQFAYMRHDGGPNYIGLVLIITIFGCMTHAIPQDKLKPLINLMDVTENLIFDIIKDLSWVSPIITFCLILCEALTFSVVGSSVLVAKHSIFLFIIVCSACLMNLLFFYPLLYYLIIKKNPLHFFANLLQPGLLAFSTSSSMSILVISYDCVAKRINIHEQICIFVLVIGGAIHLSGLILYGTIALLYMALVYNIEFSFIDYIYLLFMIPIYVASQTSTQLIIPRLFRMSGLPIEAVLDIGPVNSIL